MSKSKNQQKKQYKTQSWRYYKDKKRFVPLYHDLLNHIAFTTLEKSAQTIYIYMLDYSCGNEIIEYPRSIYKNITTAQTFSKSIKQLVEHGFIDIIECGKTTRTKNKYKFSDKWKDYKKYK